MILLDDLPNLCAGFVPGQWYFSPAVTPSTATAVTATGALFAQFFPFSGCSIGVLGIEATVVPASCVGRAALYAPGAGGIPGKLLQEAAAEVNLSVGINTWTFSPAAKVPADGLWAVVVFDTSTPPTLRTGAATGTGLGTTNFQTPRRGIQAGWSHYPTVQGAMPPNFPTSGIAVNSSTIPLIGVGA